LLVRSDSVSEAFGWTSLRELWRSPKLKFATPLLQAWDNRGSKLRLLRTYWSRGAASCRCVTSSTVEFGWPRGSAPDCASH
jgi:hypothetical protein